MSTLASSLLKLWTLRGLALLGLAVSARAEHYRVYLLGGQSNGNGRGDAAELSAPPWMR